MTELPTTTPAMARPRIELLRSARSPRQSEAGEPSSAAKAFPAADRAKAGEASFFERSTARRETGITGASGGAARAAPKGFRPAPAGENARRDGDAGIGKKTPAALPEIGRSKQKPKRLYDQKAASITKTLSERERAAAADSRKKRLSDNAKLAIAFALLVALGVGLYFSIPEVTRVAAVSVRGMTNVGEAEVLEALALTPETNLVNADIPAMESRILANPKVASARIGRTFPDKLVVDLVERKAVACVLVTEDTGMRSIAIDEEGVAFAYMDSIASPGRLPILSGIRFERFAPGQRLPEYLRPLLRDIAELSQESPSLLEAFSEIKIEKISDSEAELLLFPSGKTAPVRMPARLTRAGLGSALLVLDILAGREGAEKIEEIDFRTGTIVYRTKEAQAG